MTNPDEPRLRKIELLAEALDLPVFSVSHMFGKYGMAITPEGEYDTRDFVRMLEQAVQLMAEEKNTPPSLVKILNTVREMGDTVESCQDWAERQFTEAGFVVYREEVSPFHCQFLLARPDDHKVTRVPVHVALGVKETTGQVGFSVSGLQRKEVSWYAFVSRPFGRMDLRARTEILKHQRCDRKNPDVSFLTFSPGADKHCFEYTIGELRSRNAPWWRDREG